MLKRVQIRVIEATIRTIFCIMPSYCTVFQFLLLWTLRRLPRANDAHVDTPRFIEESH